MSGRGKTMSKQAARALRFAYNIDTCQAFHAAALSPDQRSFPFASMHDIALSICLSFLSTLERFRIAALVSRQWNRVSVLPTSNADSIVRLQRPLAEAVQPSQGLLRWASQRAAGVSSSSASFPLLPSPPSVPFGPDTPHPNANSSVHCLVAAHLGGEASNGYVWKLKSDDASTVGPNPPYLHEAFGWPSLARAVANRGSGHVHAESWQRRASFEAWSRASPAHVESLTIRSPYWELSSIGDPVELGGGDDEWLDLLRTVSPALAAASATVAAPFGMGKWRNCGSEAKEQFLRAAVPATKTASARAEKLQFDPADSPFPRLRSLTIEGSGLSWPIVQALLRACPSIVHLSVPTDASAECKAACAVLTTRGPEATVNEIRISDSPCALCGQHAAPLLTCETEDCNLTGCGPCLLSTSDRHHFVCTSTDWHDSGGAVYCFPSGPCDDHVGFQCPDCISAGAGDSSPLVCDDCGCLVCWEHYALRDDDSCYCPRCRHDDEENDG